MIAGQQTETSLSHGEDRSAVSHSEKSRARQLAAAFVFYGLVATAFLSINMPPFQNPDEPAHFARAAQVADGDLVGARFSQIGSDGSSHVTAGGRIDPALMAAAASFDSLPTHPDVRATRALWAPDIHWSGARALQPFANTAVYPPFFYLPSAVGILVGQQMQLSIVRTLTISRLLTGVAAVAVGALAIAIASGAAAWIFTILTLPMALSLIASASQDALLLACGALAGALLLRILRSPHAENGKLLAGLAITLSLVAMARPPYGALAIVPLGISKVPQRWRMVAAIAVAACVLIWSLIATATALTNTGALVGADPSAQMAHIREHPLLIVHILWATLARQWGGYFIEFVGVLGWMDTQLPRTYYVAAGAMLIVAAAATMLGTKTERIRVHNLSALAAGLLLSVAALFAIQYLTWTVPGHGTVDGIQGRYFLPLAPAVAAFLPALGNTRAARLQNALLAAVAMFPVISLAVVMRAVVLRYYLG